MKGQALREVQAGGGQQLMHLRQYKEILMGHDGKQYRFYYPRHYYKGHPKQVAAQEILCEAVESGHCMKPLVCKECKFKPVCAGADVKDQDVDHPMRFKWYCQAYDKVID